MKKLILILLLMLSSCGTPKYLMVQTTVTSSGSVIVRKTLPNGDVELWKDGELLGVLSADPILRTQ